MTQANQNLMLNLGCGSNFHPDWTNLDLVPVTDEVQQADLSQGIPFPEGSADVVYHSHVLEHLSRSDAEKMIADCFRVLRPGGILRLAVPDLEQIAGQYLETIYKAWQEPNASSLADHHWMQLELIDQIVRRQSGGEMGKYMSSPDIPNQDFVQTRLGQEAKYAQMDQSRNLDHVKKTSWWATRIKKLKRKLIRLMFGKEFLQQMDEIRFRQSGEIHQWMYDRVSLRQILQESGFTEFQVCRATESRIEGFVDFGLDAREGKTLKPDSIFVEATKPALAALRAA